MSGGAGQGLARPFGGNRTHQWRNARMGFDSQAQKHLKGKRHGCPRPPVREWGCHKMPAERSEPKIGLMYFQ